MQFILYTLPWSVAELDLAYIIYYVTKIDLFQVEQSVGQYGCGIV